MINALDDSITIYDDNDEITLTYNDDDEITLTYDEDDNEDKTLSITPPNTWKIIIADDEPTVHQATKLILKDLQFENKPVSLISAYSGAETKTLLEKHPDVAVIFLDVVMEKNDSGLDVTKYVRKIMHNEAVQIILRTGQPGQAPEHTVVMSYEINDYVLKTDLTHTKLITTTIIALRAYQNNLTHKTHNRQLENQVIERTQALLETNQQLQQEIAKHRKMEMALKKNKEAAEVANRAKSTFLATMSHELRTPLNGILGYAQILKRLPNITKEQKNGLNVIQHSGEYLLNLINDILDLTKIEAGKFDIHLTNFNLPTLIKNIIKIIRIRAEHKGINFQLEILPKNSNQQNNNWENSLPNIVYGDKKRLRQVLISLLDNALKFTDNGQVTLKIAVIDNQLSSQNEQLLSSDKEKITAPYIHFQIEDTGSGIALQELEVIFKPFQRAKNQHDETEGTGLGLTISRHLVEAMGGKLHVKSILGQGSIFWFRIPLTTVENTTNIVPINTKQIIGIKGKKTRILIIDTISQNRTELVNLLSPVGIETIEAENSSDGLAKANQFNPDIILVSLRMPKINGVELASKMRQYPLLQNKVIIALSSSVFEDDRQKSLAAEYNEFLPKPIQPTLLFEYLQQYLAIEWIYKKDEDNKLNKLNTEHNNFIVIPPQDVLQNLLKLAMIGDVRAITGYLEKLTQKDNQLIPFVKKIQTLANLFQTEKICNLLNTYLNKTEENEF